MSYLNLLYEKKHRIVYITIDRPKVLNAIDPPTGQAICQAINDFNEDDDLWVAIFTGAGDRAFSAGADIKATAQRRDESGRVLVTLRGGQSRRCHPRSVGGAGSRGQDPFGRVKVDCLTGLSDAPNRDRGRDDRGSYTIGV